MVVMNFTYIKDDGETTSREVVRLQKTKSYVDAVDLGHLSESEAEEFKKVYAEYEEKIAPFIQKAFRRFSKENMKDLTEEKH